MVWIFVAILTIISAAFLYAQRRHTRLRLAGVNLVQMYYLAVAAPLILLSIINIGLDIIKRPSVLNLNLPDQLIFSLYVLSTCIGIVGTAIHSTSATIADDFGKSEISKARETNEIFHGPLSHYMTYIGGILAVAFLAILDFNHPDIRSLLSIDWAIILGVLLGLAATIGIIWSTYISGHLVVSFLATSILTYLLWPFLNDLGSFPVAILSLVAETVVFGGLLIALVIFKSNNSLTRKFIKMFFPSGHPYHG